MVIRGSDEDGRMLSIQMSNSKANYLKFPLLITLVPVDKDSKSGHTTFLQRFVPAKFLINVDTSINPAHDHAAMVFYLLLKCYISMRRRMMFTLITIFTITGIASSGYAITTSARPASFALSGTGVGLIDCIGGKSFQMTMIVHASQNAEGAVSGIITISDEDGATTIASIDGGKINGKSFQLSSNDPNSIDDIPICHAGDDPNHFELRGVADEEAKVRFEAVCKDEGEEGIECSSSKGTFEGTVAVTTG